MTVFLTVVNTRGHRHIKEQVEMIIEGQVTHIHTHTHTQTHRQTHQSTYRSEIFFPFSPSHEEFGPGVDSPATMVRSGLPHHSGSNKPNQIGSSELSWRPLFKGRLMFMRTDFFLPLEMAM